MPYSPPIKLTPKHVDLVSEISEKLGVWRERHGGKLSPQLRRENRIRTIQASLAIEANTLTLEQVTDIVDGKRVAGSEREILEVKNAIATYDRLDDFQESSVSDFLKAHQFLLCDLAPDAGKFRSGGVGVYQGDQLVHMAPPADRVPFQIQDLLESVAENEFHPLLISSIAHYEIEFIHPFSDGNGRMGRLWQTLILSRWKSELAFLPIETVVHHRQSQYYDALAASDRAAEAGPFTEFILEAIAEKLSESDQVGDQVTDQVKKLISVMKTGEEFSLKELMARLGMSHRPTFRKNYLIPAIEAGRVNLTDPDSPTSPQQRYRLS